MTATLHTLKQTVCNTIDATVDELNHISQDIWKHPEIGFEEYHAHTILVSFLEKYGFQVEKGYVLDTAFKAVYGDGPGPNVAVCCEYDALPEIGHACGHNLITEVGVGAAIGIKAAMDTAGKPLGKVYSIYSDCKSILVIYSFFLLLKFPGAELQRFLPTQNYAMYREYHMTTCITTSYVEDDANYRNPKFTHFLAYW